MRTSLFRKRFLIGCLLLALLAACGTAVPDTPTPEPTATPAPPTSTPIPPTDTPTPPTATPETTSCEEIEGNCLELIWDGESCTYEGPEEIKTGSVTLIFRNKTEEPAGTGLVRLLGDATTEDMIDFVNQSTTRDHWPSFALVLDAGWAYPGKSNIWEGFPELGVHTMVCFTDPPWDIWVGGTFTVED